VLLHPEQREPCVTGACVEAAQARLDTFGNGRGWSRIDIAPAVQRRARSKRGRFTHISHQLLETNREAAALVLCEKPAHFTGATM
jgi:hypothetical protein